MAAAKPGGPDLPFRAADMDMYTKHLAAKEIAAIAGVIPRPYAPAATR
jgi:hypothetical protein